MPVVTYTSLLSLDALLKYPPQQLNPSLWLNASESLVMSCAVQQHAYSELPYFICVSHDHFVSNYFYLFFYNRKKNMAHPIVTKQHIVAYYSNITPCGWEKITSPASRKNCNLKIV